MGKIKTKGEAGLTFCQDAKGFTVEMRPVRLSSNATAARQEFAAIELALTRAYRAIGELRKQPPPPSNIHVYHRFEVEDDLGDAPWKEI